MITQKVFKNHNKSTLANNNLVKPSKNKLVENIGKIYNFPINRYSKKFTGQYMEQLQRYS